MSSYNIAPKDVQDALREQNGGGPGKIGEMPKVFMNMSSNIKEDFWLKITRISL
jgi:hypothetical protein